MDYIFSEDELPFQKGSLLRFLCKATVMRRQYDNGEHVNFSAKTIVRMFVPKDPALKPFIVATCPENGFSLSLHVHVKPERELNNRNDAIAYLRLTLCNEAITVTERDIANVERHGATKHYTKEFFQGLIVKYRHRISTFHTFNYYGTPVYE